MSELVVGIDAGGTGIRAVLADQKSGVLRAEARCASSADGRPRDLRVLLAELCPGVESNAVVSVCAGITKITRSGVRDAWESELRVLLPASAVEVVPDYVIAFHGAIPGGVGIAVVAGTGSVVYGDNGVTTVRVGGRGWEWGDEGSGTWLTTEAVRQTIHARDGLSPRTPLTQAVEDFFATLDPAALGEAARQKAASEGRGFLVPLLRERAAQGDTEAANLFVGAGGWLAAYARAAYTQLGFTDEKTVVVATVGGLWGVGDGLVAPFARVVKRWHPNVAVTAPVAAPVMGAVERARRAALTASEP